MKRSHIFDRDTLAARVDGYIQSISTPGIDTEEPAAAITGPDFTANRYFRAVFVVTSILAIATTIWHLLYLVHPVLLGVPFRIVHLASMGTLLFLTTLSTDDSWRGRVWNVSAAVMICGLIVTSAYNLLEFQKFWMRAGAPSQLDVYVSTVLILITIEGARRAFGNALAGVGVVALLYGLFGNHIPIGLLQHGGLSYSRLVTGIVVPDLVGLYGFLLNLSATLITLFVFFGMFMQWLGGAEYLGDLARRLAGGVRSGPAQIAIVSSGLMGMLTGAAVANVAATGSYSIPLMKRLGYEKDFAGAIESVASTGGQIMPPVMGASAFLMASITGRSYFKIVIAATIPAVIYYFTLMLTAHIRAIKKGLSPIETESQVSLRRLLIRSYLLVPIAYIIVSMQQGDAPLIAAWNGLKSLMVLFIVYQVAVNRTDLRSLKSEVVVPMIKAFDDASRTMAPIAIVIAEIAWVIQIFKVTGVLSTISQVIVYYTGGNLLLLLITVAIVCIVFGFGIPTSAAYLLVALIAAPALTSFGVDLIGAHMFVFYFAILSAISPPVAAAVLVSTGISKGSFTESAKYAIRFALPIYILPFVWIYNPAILAQGTPMGIASAVVIMLSSVVMVVSFFEGHLLTEYSAIERGLALVISIGLIVPLRNVRIVMFLLLGLFVTVHAVKWNNSLPALRGRFQDLR